MRNIISSTLLALGFLLMVGATGSAEFYGHSIESFTSAMAGLLMIGAAVPVSSDITMHRKKRKHQHRKEKT